MINTSDLRKGNWVRTELGIRKVNYVIWSDVYVYGEDGRTLYVREVEGVGIGEIENIKGCQSFIKEVLKHWLFVHELQNWFYWHNKQELKITL